MADLLTPENVLFAFTGLLALLWIVMLVVVIVIIRRRPDPDGSRVVVWTQAERDAHALRQAGLRNVERMKGQ